MWEQALGRRSDVVTNWVERGAVRKFAAAIGDLNPLYYDEALARQSRYGRLIAPPTFPITFDYGHIEGLTLPSAGLIHGTQSFDYARPLYVGEEVSCHTLFERAYDRQGSRGLMSFLVFARVGADRQGQQIYAMSATLIVTEAVRLAMGA